MPMLMPRRSINGADPVVRAGFRPIARPAIFALVCASGLFAGGPGFARDDAPHTVRGWTVAESKDGKGCFLTREYDRNGETTLLLGLDIDDTNRLVVLNANWSIKPRDQLKLNFRLLNSSYPAHFAVGITSEGKQGFVTSFGVKFPSYFAASKTLEISRGDVPVERLDLDGADVAVAALRDCVADRQAKPADGKARFDDIPSDPFAPPPARGPKK